MSYVEENLPLDRPASGQAFAKPATTSLEVIEEAADTKQPPKTTAPRTGSNR
jgi:hypothetical protein